MKFSDSRRGHSDQISCLAFSPDGQYFASGSFDKTVRLWRADNSAPITPYGDHAHTISLLAFSPDGQHLAASSWDGTVQIWRKGRGGWEDDFDDEALDDTQTLEGHEGPVNGVLWLGESGRAVTCGDDCTVRLWDAADEFELKQMSVERRPLHFCRFPHPDPIVLVVCDGSPGWLLWCHVEKGEILGARKSPPASHVAVSPNGEYIAAAGDGRVVFWWVQGEKFGEAVSACGNRGGKVYSVAFSPDSKHLAVAGENETVEVWDFLDDRLVFEGRGHRGAVHDVVFSPDGRWLVSGGADHTVLLWDVGSHLAKPAALSQ